METVDLIAALRRAGEALANAAARTDLDAPIPPCPGWRLRDLLAHISGVHRWATAHVAERRARPMDQAEEDALFASAPDDAALLDWFREGHATLVRALETAPPDLACWSFLPAPSPLAFWARRQAHETAIHRVDAQSAGGPIEAFSPDFAADGLDELLYGFASRPRGKLRADPPRALHLSAPDAARTWLVRIEPERVVVSDGGEDDVGDCAVRGDASELYLLLWNRRAPEGLEVQGDASVLDLWRQLMQVRWS
jgi:uncharacterized protein (TIGR03083 family)